MRFEEFLEDDSSNQTALSLSTNIIQNTITQLDGSNEALKNRISNIIQYFVVITGFGLTSLSLIFDNGGNLGLDKGRIFPFLFGLISVIGILFIIIFRGNVPDLERVTDIEKWVKDTMATKEPVEIFKDYLSDMHTIQNSMMDINNKHIWSVKYLNIFWVVYTLSWVIFIALSF